MLVNCNTFPHKFSPKLQKGTPKEKKNIFKLGNIAHLSVRLGFRVDEAAGDVSVACSQRLGTGLSSDRGQVARGGDGGYSFVPTHQHEMPTAGEQIWYKFPGATVS